MFNLLIFCKMYGKQYVGSTTAQFRFWWNNYGGRSYAKKGEDHLQKHLHDKLLSKDYDCLFNNGEINFLDKTDPVEPEKREKKLRTKLRTLAPMSLNIEEWSLRYIASF